MKNSSKFAFLVHPSSFQNIFFVLKPFEALLKLIPPRVLKNMLKSLPSFCFARVSKIRSKVPNTEVKGWAILCPLLPDQMVSLNARFVKQKVLAAAQLAEKFGANVIGLGGFTSIVTNQGKDLVDCINTAVTTGNTYTACLVIKGLIKAAALLDKDLSKLTLLIVGATGNIGRVCTRVLSQKVAKTIVVSRDQKKLDDFCADLKIRNVNVCVSHSVEESSREADIILTVTSSLTTILDVSDLKKGVIVCDVSVPPNIARDVFKFRDDIFVFEGGYSSVPYKEDLMSPQLRTFFPHSAIYGCLAETILLALDKNFKSFSLGTEEITEKSLQEIELMAFKHGFGLAPFFCGEFLLDSAFVNKLKGNGIKNK